ncbi:hypothetical protein RND71_039032 [Anisodus tanguticus]|uniref:Lysosomal Pro-X carboxypeptidase n=1 Tax=Anisodus tanguticus TaxID=243964 RepID=A0AAE1R1E9_9SOLA|nr:hypothetical protein RND71_039032 [Anisodus tanguticus]
MKMKLLFLLVVCFSPISFAKIPATFPSSYHLSSLASKGKELLNYETNYFTQILDHFNYNPQSYQNFQQRYLLNDKYWGGSKNNAPIFVYTGNEGDIEWFTQNTGFMFEIAPHFKALLVFIEHRFYGKSIPYRGDKEIAYSNKSTLGLPGHSPVAKSGCYKALWHGTTWVRFPASTKNLCMLGNLTLSHWSVVHSQKN